MALDDPAGETLRDVDVPGDLPGYVAIRGKAIRPSSRTGQNGFQATSQWCPSGSAK